mmetsp:Transcript_34947/g.62905  ORF Transcript_34947/g.62905 Transcript_34947/m.62905 type:complete len:607 (+) Transcript_34947:67-1887(+)
MRLEMLPLLFLAFQPATAFNPSSSGSRHSLHHTHAGMRALVAMENRVYGPVAREKVVMENRFRYKLDQRRLDHAMNKWWTCNATEITDELPLAVVGKIPSWLSGKLIRNGPGMFKYGNTEVKHQFDGLSKVTKFSIQDGRVSLRARFLRTKLYNETMKQQRIPPVITMVPMMPPLDFTGRVSAVLNHDLHDVGNIFVWRTGDRTYATYDGVFETEFDPDSLETLGRMEYKNSNRENTFSGAHKQPALAQEGCGSTFGWQGALSSNPFIPENERVTLNLYRDLPNLTRQFIGQTFTHAVPVIHSFGVTKNYILLVVPSLTVDMTDFLYSFAHENASGLSFLKWSGNRKSMIHVFDAHSMDPLKAPIRSFVTESMYMNHHINAYEDEKTGEVTMDLIGYTDGSFILNPHGFGNTDVMKDGPTRRNISHSQTPGRIRRYKLDMTGVGPHVATYENITAQDTDSGWEYYIEMPRFNERRLRGSPYRFVYGMSSHRQLHNDQLPNIVKVDLQNGGASTEWYKRHHFPSEPIFVPRPGATDEDDGVLLSVVLDGVAEMSYLLIIDAKTMTTLAKAYTPSTMPCDVHGQFFPDDSMYPDDLGELENVDCMTPF